MSKTIAAFLAMLGCAGGQGTRPGDIGAAQHEASAARSETAAEAHARQYDPNARTPGWTSDRNPTEQHRAEALRLRALAAQHRSASAALRQAEARACVGISEADRDVSPFAHREDIESAEPLNETSIGSRTPVWRLRGTVVVFRAVPGLTVEWLQRIVDCHMARVAVLGPDAPGHGDCPLAVGDITARVSSTGNGFAVAIRSDSSEVAREVARRAAALTPRVSKGP